MFGDYSANNVIWSGKKISQSDFIAFQRAPGMLLDHRDARAMQNRVDRTIKRAIDLGCLREIGNFRRAAVVSNRREQIILDHCPQGDVRTKTFRLAKSPR